MRIKSLSLAAAFLALSAFTPRDVAASGAEIAHLRIAVFVGGGARNIGAFRWLEIATLAENAETTPVDGASIRAGALDAADVLVMPGGSASVEAKELGADGRERVKSFVRGGGGYIGTCAGFYLLTEPSPGRKANYLGLIPFRDTIDGMNGEAELMFKFNDRAEALAGIPKGGYRIRYAHGPVPVRSDREVEGTRAEVVATFDCDYNPRRDPRPPKAGHPAAVAAECGKGRVFVFTCHPESDYDDRTVIEGAFRYVTRGREVRWRYPQRKAGQLAVGFVSDDVFGPETGRLVQRLVTQGEFDIIPANAKFVEEGALRHFDAVLVPPCAGDAESRKALDGANIEQARRFVARGGRVVAWGNAAERLENSGLEGVARVADGESAIAELRKFAAEPVCHGVSGIVPPAKVERPVRAAVFAGDGCPLGNIPQLLEFSPEYTVGVVSAKDIAAGALRDFDLLCVPGGNPSIACDTLGEAGRGNIVEFVRGGGKYYGVCGGALLVSRTEFRPGADGISSGDAPFLGLVPFRGDLPHHSRGEAPVKIRLTDEGKSVFRESKDVRTTWYAGGPAFIPAGEVEDSDVRVFAEYESRVLSTSSPEATPDMTGKAAVLGGRVGKGRVYAQCPHPEFHENTFDMVRDGFKWLAGVRPTGTLPPRVRGAKSIVVKIGLGDGMNATVNYVLKSLLHDARFDCRIVSDMGHNELSHYDAVVMCLFGKDSWTPELKAFAANGGKVVFVADTAEKRRVAAEFDGAIVVESCDKVIDVL